MQLLGNVLAEAEGYPDWASDNYASLMTPLSMTSTKTRRQWRTPADTVFPSKVALGHKYDCDTGDVVVRPAYENDHWLEAHGALYSTITDMLRWLLYNMNRLGPAHMRDLLPTIRAWRGTREDPADLTKGMALGWNIEADPCEPPGQAQPSPAPPAGHSWRYEKGGTYNSTNSYIMHSPWTRRGVVVLLNVDKEIVASEEIARLILHTLP